MVSLYFTFLSWIKEIKAWSTSKFVIASLLNATNLFLMSVSYRNNFLSLLILVGPDNILTDRHFIILLTTIIFTLPLSLYRDIAKLGKVNHNSSWFSSLSSMPLENKCQSWPNVFECHPTLEHIKYFRSADCLLSQEISENLE